MPTYEYKREDGTKFEIVQSIKAEPLKKCPKTGQKVTKCFNWSGETIMRGWSPDKALRKEKLKNKPGVTTLPHYKKKIDENTEKARKLKQEARDNS